LRIVLFDFIILIKMERTLYRSKSSDYAHFEGDIEKFGEEMNKADERKRRDVEKKVNYFYHREQTG